MSKKFKYDMDELNDKGRHRRALRNDRHWSSVHRYVILQVWLRRRRCEVQAARCYF